jgi:hypothetical protein
MRPRIAFKSGRHFPKRRDDARTPKADAKPNPSSSNFFGLIRVIVGLWFSASFVFRHLYFVIFFLSVRHQPELTELLREWS